MLAKKPKQPKWNWLDLPSDVMANIIQRVSVFDILEKVQKVCTTWRKICKDPAMWRFIHMDKFSPEIKMIWLRKMCKNVVDRSQGQLVDITMVDFCDFELLRYIADRSCQLRRLDIVYLYGDLSESLTNGLKKFTLLEELSLCKIYLSKEAIETTSKCCPLLTILKLNKNAVTGETNDEIAIAIGKNLPELRHLELIGNNVSNIGLQTILDGCGHLELLDLRQCLYIDLKGDIGKRCLEQIKSLKLPNDSLEGCPFIKEEDSDDDDCCMCGHGDFNYHAYNDYHSDDDFFVRHQAKVSSVAST